MTTITPLPVPESRRRPRGFTLVELMVSTSLATVLMAAVITVFIFLGRSGANLGNYADMEAQARRAIETFAQDVRMAKTATWNSPHSLTLEVVTSSGASRSYTYAYNTASATFTRSYGAVGSTLISGITAGSFQFTAYKINTAGIPLTNDGAELAAASALTKQIQISLRSTRSTRTVSDATNAVISARFILRNKIVTA
jgi:prepilin-type N-terminal cleavage/methylation domain-containing protein